MVEVLRLSDVESKIDSARERMTMVKLFDLTLNASNARLREQASDELEGMLAMRGLSMRIATD